MQIKWIKIHLPHNLKPKIGLSKITYRNFLEKQLIRPIYKFAKSVTEINRKI